MARLQKTLTDYVVIAISPALIIAMIASLVFFLVEVYYVGQYQMRLTWILGCFVVAAVLIGRISIDEGREHAMFFAVPLAIATLLALFRFVEFSGALATLSTPISIAMIALIWWCADRLTWDCTVIDERQDASGEGLLQTAGLEGTSDSEGESSEPVDATTSREEPVPRGLWQRFIDRRNRPHAPGVWVVYFSMVALPIFGFCQRFISTGDLDARRFAFKLFCVFVASSLGLLMTTSFLGLRRYLRQRRLEMPADMAGVWLAVGAAVIIGLLLFCMLLPRPYAEYSITHLVSNANSPSDLNSSRYSIGKEGVEDDQNPNPTETTSDDGESGADTGGNQGSSDQSDPDGQGKPSTDPGQSDAQAKDSQSQDGNDTKAKNSDSKTASSEQEQGSNKSPNSKPKESPAGGEQESDPTDGEQSRQQQSSKSNQQRDRAQNDEQRDSERSGRDQSDNESEQASESPQSSFDPMQMVTGFFGGLTHLLKWMYYLVVFAAVAYFGWRYRDTIRDALNNFIQAIRDFWARLFGGSVEQPVEEEMPASAAASLAPFSSFTDPFANNSASRLSGQDLVKYTFAALEAWARENNCGRAAEQTPHEFARQVSGTHRGLTDEVRNLADLYCQAAFARQAALPKSELRRLAGLWQKLREPATADAV